MKRESSETGETSSASIGRKEAWLFQLFAAVLAGGLFLGLFIQLRGWAYAALYWAAFLALLALLPWSQLRDPVFRILQDWWHMDRRATWFLFFTSSAATAVFTFAAHGFLFSNEFFSHDSVNYIEYGFGSFYISMGRFLIPFYEMAKGAHSAPWLVGVLFFIWMSAAAALILRLTGIWSVPARALATGLLCTNTALTLTGATYVYCMDEYALALLLAAAAAWFFCRCRHGELFGILCLLASLAIYQSYFTIAPALCFLTLIRELLSNERLGVIIRKGLRYLALTAASFCLYYPLWTLSCRAAGVEKARLGESMLGGGLSKLPEYFLRTARHFFEPLCSGDGDLGALSQGACGLLLVTLGLWLAGWLASGKLRFGNKLFLILAVCLLPVALNSADFLLLGAANSLCLYGRELIYVFVLLCASHPPFPKLSGRYRALAAAAVLIILWQNVVFANQAYMKKDLEKTATISLVTRVIDRIESTEGYIPGETPVAVVGRLHDNPYVNQARPAFQGLSGKTGMWFNYAVSSNPNFRRYVENYLAYPLIWDTSTDFAAMEAVEEMPLFPAAGCSRMISDTVVLRLA